MLFQTELSVSPSYLAQIFYEVSHFDKSLTAGTETLQMKIKLQDSSEHNHLSTYIDCLGHTHNVVINIYIAHSSSVYQWWYMSCTLSTLSRYSYRILCLLLFTSLLIKTIGHVSKFMKNECI